MSESGMRQRVVKELKSLNAVPIENPIRSGTPDVNYVEGWLELKWARAWPKREESLVTCKHFTPQQRNWLWRRWDAGGNVFLLYQCKREWFLFEGDLASKRFGKMTKAQMQMMAYHYWPKGLGKRELANVLREFGEA